MYSELLILCLLVAMLPIALIVRSRILRNSIVIIYVMVVAMTQLTFEPLYRSVNSSRHAEGKWTEDFRDGAGRMLEAVRPLRPYVLIGSAALGVLAFRRKEQGVKPTN